VEQNILYAELNKDSKLAVFFNLHAVKVLVIIAVGIIVIGRGVRGRRLPPSYRGRGWEEEDEEDDDEDLDDDEEISPPAE